MAFELPDLDRKSYQELAADLVRRIPQYTRQWTDYNDSDPGITLLQLLAWLDESLLYQANAIPVQTDENYLRWVLGLAFSGNQTAYSLAATANHDAAFLALQQVLVQLEQDVVLNKPALQQYVLAYVGQPYMALTLSNIEALALETNQVIAQQAAGAAAGSAAATPLLVRRAYAQSAGQGSVAWILSDAQWRYQYPPYPNQAGSGSSGTRRKVLMIEAPDGAAAERTLLAAVNKYLAPRVIAGNRVQVRAAQFTDINVTLIAGCVPTVRLDVTLGLLFARLFAYFLPCEGGAAGQGWPYDEAPTEAALRQLILAMPGIASIDGLVFDFIPTLVLDRMAVLDVNAQLADLPPGTPAMFYRGLPRLRCLDVSVRSNAA
ncbi:hypothetical protein GCN74_26250 [Janthinobacterium sp. FT14W]|uniref:hypothetical protein n=1 Tax=Janthinobacterium sp. FT14W TaxID=2654253 RepID=UPI00126492B5|nr:hypothetical protein [Janthinobacterium sp. FT14W]KAB8051906.1 hypothetical protein GCN74_26250 [Janthinobacterium sp. FT14W]